MTGEDCFIAKVFVRALDDLERVIDQLLPFAQTNTSIIQSSPAHDSRRRAASRSPSPSGKRTASPVEGAVSSPCHMTRRPRTTAPTGQPVTIVPS